MQLNKISLPEAYMIETLRSNGITDQDLLEQIAKMDVSHWQNLNENFDFNKLVNLAERDEQAFKSIILDGYTVKFVTIKGIRTLLQLKFNKVQDADYSLTEKGITNLNVSEEQLSTLKQMLSKNWVIHEKDLGPTKEIKIELI